MIIRVQVVDRIYEVRILRSDSKSEETIRKAVRNVNEAVDRLKQLGMKDKNDQDFLAMAAMQFAIKALDSENQTELQPLLEELREVNFQLSSYLEE
jgi:hypothetical protein